MSDTIAAEAAPPVVTVSASQEIMRMSDANPSDEAVAVDPRGMSFLQALALCDGGGVVKEINASFEEVLHTLSGLDVNEGIRKSKGGLTIKVGVDYEDGTARLKVDLSIKTPKAPTRAAVFWITGDNRLTPENPRQMRMFQDIPRRTVKVV